MSQDASLDEIQHIVKEIEEFIYENASTEFLDNGYWMVLQIIL